jgi:heptosyltransferase-2
MAFNKILLRGPNWVGDAVLAIAAMKAVRDAYPQAEITLLVRPWVAGLFSSAPFIDRVWKEPRPAGLKDWMRLSRSIRTKGFDLALLFPNSFESAAMTFFGRVPQRVGYATDGRSWLLTHSIKPTSLDALDATRRHQVHYYLELASGM